MSIILTNEKYLLYLTALCERKNKLEKEAQEIQKLLDELHKEAKEMSKND